MGTASKVYSNALWEFSRATCGLKKAEWNRITKRDGDKIIYRAELVEKKNCIYFYALTRKSAERKALKYIKELNLTPVKTFFGKRLSKL